MDPAAISTGMGEGMAQIFKPQEDFLGEAMKAAEAKKKESVANKAKAMQALSKMAEYHVWTERDGAEFAKKQKEVWDGLQGKDLDDPNTMLWLNQKQQELTYLADLSNTAKEQYINGTKTYQQGGDKYFSDVVDRMQEFANPANALNKNITWNPGWFMEDPNIDKRISELAKENIATAEANKKQKASVGAIPGSDGREFVKETLTQEFSLDDAKNQVRTLLTSPAFNKAAEIKWNQDPNKANYNSVYDWAEAVYAPKLANESRIENVSQLSTGGAGGAGSLPNQGWNVSLKEQATEEFNTQQRSNIIKNLTDDAVVKRSYQRELEDESLPKVSKDGKERFVTFDEYVAQKADDAMAKYPKKAGYTYDIGKSSPTGEARIINPMDVPSEVPGEKGIKFQPTQISFPEQGKGEPMLIGLNDKGETVRIPYSKLHAKLNIETNNQWQNLKKQIIDQVGYDPFTPYESKKAPSGGAKVTTSTTTTGATPTTATKTTTGGATAATQTTSNQYGGDWNDEWTKAILAHERAVGFPGGISWAEGSKNGDDELKHRYDDATWLGKNAKRDIVKEYVSEVKKQLPEYSSLPDAFKIRLVDYKFNSGRDPRVAILEGLGLIKGDITYKGSDGKDKTTSIRTYLHNEGKADVDKYWNKNKAKIDMSDPATMKAFDDARANITKATNVNDPNYKGNIDKNQLPRITLADQIVANKPTTNVKRDAAGNTYGGGAKEPTYTIKGKKYTLSELKGMGYTEQQVESYKNK